MPDAPLTFEAIRAMDDETLHRTIAEQVERWRPIAGVAVRSHSGCTHEAPDGGLYTVPAYTACWSATMGLRQAHGQYIDLVWAGTVQLVRTAYGNMHTLTCTTPEEVRRAVCQLVLWQSSQRQSWSAEEAARQERYAAAENRLANGDAPYVTR